MSVRTDTQTLEQKPSLRRIILPITLVLGTLFCGYAALFFGVKEDLPAPPNATRFPLSISNTAIVKDQFPEDTKNYRSADIAVYVLRDSPQDAATYWRNAFVTKRNWQELAPPSKPKDAGNVNFTMLGFNRVGSKIIIAIAPADGLLALNNDFATALKTANFRAGDTVAIMIAGDLK